MGGEIEEKGMKRGIGRRNDRDAGKVERKGTWIRERKGRNRYTREREMKEVKRMAWKEK